MNAKHLLLAATAAFVALNFTSCKEKGDDFDYTFENCVESVGSISINDGDTIRSKTIWPTNLVEYSSIKIKDGIKDVRGGCLLYAGTSKDKMKLFSGKKLIYSLLQHIMLNPRHLLSTLVIPHLVKNRK